MAVKRRIVVAVVAGLLTVLPLTACVSAPSAPVETEAPTKSATPTPTPTKPPELDPDGSAADNLKYWEYVVKTMAESAGMTDGSVMIQNLVTAGFNKADMELTPNETAIGELSDSVIFSVRFQGECLIGQIFQSWAWQVATSPMLSTGKCLIGTTRPIDF